MPLNEEEQPPTLQPQPPIKTGMTLRSSTTRNAHQQAASSDNTPGIHRTASGQLINLDTPQQTQHRPQLTTTANMTQRTTAPETTTSHPSPLTATASSNVNSPANQAQQQVQPRQIHGTPMHIEQVTQSSVSLFPSTVQGNKHEYSNLSTHTTSKHQNLPRPFHPPTSMEQKAAQYDLIIEILAHSHLPPSSTNCQQQQRPSDQTGQDLNMTTTTQRQHDTPSTKLRDYVPPTAVFTALSSMPKFSGSHGDSPAADWIEALGKKVAVHNIPESHKWRMMASQLEGRAEQWFGTLSLAQKQNWYVLSQLFIDAFRNQADSALASQQLEVLTQKTLDVGTFANKLYKLNNTAQTGRNPPYPENVIRDMFFERLNASIKTQLLYMGHDNSNSLPTKWNDLLNICLTAENRARLNSNLEEKLHGSVLDKKRLNMALRSYDHQRQHDDPRYSDSEDSDSEPPKHGTSTERVPLECHRCGEQGHLHNMCQVDVNQLWCYKCREYRHIAQNCYQPPETGNDDNNSV